MLLHGSPYLAFYNPLQQPSALASCTLSCPPNVTSLPVQRWSQSMQRLFEKHLAHLTASAGFVFCWVDNSKWHTLCHDFIPGAKLPS
ncbi:hypothetical protein CONPUDRAFT_53103 [Coniophora puteana RWD-64-598 SS2]|uniref:Uncharacterized protein n=1 Tax=Coniophora puteana (strain RWD-64-598) TaxID=741705 RepID=A0A5M3MV03_CONPW|nr:uncharacterized protein CONPUDRAFT_53103 [Coniophora puteana RWD-64-598 SS2]EIW82969.1 hypothetical protein CONPUDRAFT_53103 [Coniophora puteana RWD-64-598 SS2]